MFFFSSASTSTEALKVPPRNAGPPFVCTIAVSNPNTDVSKSKVVHASRSEKEMQKIRRCYSNGTCPLHRRETGQTASLVNNRQCGRQSFLLLRYSLTRGQQKLNPAPNFTLALDLEDGASEVLHDRNVLHDLCNRDVAHRVEEQQRSFYGLLNSQDRGNRPLHHDREIDDVEDEQQLRKIRRLLHGAT